MIHQLVQDWFPQQFPAKSFVENFHPCVASVVVSPPLQAQIAKYAFYGITLLARAWGSDV